MTRLQKATTRIRSYNFKSATRIVSIKPVRLTKKILKDLMSGKITEVCIKVQPLDEIFQLVKSVTKDNPFDYIEGDDTNGWEVDFYYRLADLKTSMLIISGSLFYGNYHIIASTEGCETSEEFSKKNTSYTVVEPTGWNMNDFHYSWYEQKITYGEYWRRLQNSITLNKYAL